VGLSDQGQRKGKHKFQQSLRREEPIEAKNALCLEAPDMKRKSHENKKLTIAQREQIMAC